MKRAYRIYIGARNRANHTFTTGDNKTVVGILNRYFKGWTLVDAEGSWEGQPESSKIVTVTTDPASIQPNSGKHPVESCAGELRGTLGQGAVMVEEGGLVSIYP